MKFCTVIWGPKSKIEFVWDKKSDHSFPYFSPFKKLHYGLWGVQSNFALFALTPIFSVLGYSIASFKFSHPVAMATNFGTKLTITQHRERQLLAVFTYPLFSGQRYLMVLFAFFPDDPYCHGNEFRNKIDYNWAPAKANCTPSPYFWPGLCNGVM